MATVPPAHLFSSHAALRSTRGRGTRTSARRAAGEATAAGTGATARRHLRACHAAAGSAAAASPPGGSAATNAAGAAAAVAAAAAGTGATAFSNGADGVDGAAAAATAACASAAAGVAHSASAAAPRPRGAPLLHWVDPIRTPPAALPARQPAVQQPQVLHVTGARHTQYGRTGGVHPGGWEL